jgi:hypothetical protein
MLQRMLPVNWRQWDTQMCAIMPKESLTGLPPVYQSKADITIKPAPESLALDFTYIEKPFFTGRRSSLSFTGCTECREPAYTGTHFY